ncbi:MAG: PspC domain-containing protein [Bacteroidales bacterium]
MKKTLTVNISGIVFHIDEDAYSRLSSYLERIKKHFAREEGSEEIISGIESRLAELFQGKKQDHRQVVDLSDVEEAIGQLGEPADISGEEEEEEQREESSHEAAYEPPPKRLFRDPDNKYIGGVCGGLGAYFQIDPVWIRIIFLLTLFAYSFGLILYIILWIVIPKARTTADRLAMRGERVTLSNIERSIKEDLNEIKRNLEDLSKKSNK